MAPVAAGCFSLGRSRCWCDTAGPSGAGIGTLVEPGGGTAIGGGIGMIVGGFIGYLSAEAAAGYLYDFAEGTMFVQLPDVPVPPE